MGVAAQRWREVLATFGSPSRPRGGPEGEHLWLGPADWRGVQVWLPRSPALAVVCPKTAAVGWWLANGGVPPDVGFVCSAHPCDSASRPVLERALGRAKRVVFVGDLDPLALVQYAELRRTLARKGVRLRYGGIDDAWLAAMRRGWNARNGPMNVHIALEAAERRLLAKLDRAVDLQRLVGPEATALLRGGHKVEIEGATNPVLYGPGHTRWLFRHLRRVGERDFR